MNTDPQNKGGSWLRTIGRLLALDLVLLSLNNIVNDMRPIGNTLTPNDLVIGLVVAGNWIADGVGLHVVTLWLTHGTSTVRWKVFDAAGGPASAHGLYHYGLKIRANVLTATRWQGYPPVPVR